MKIHKFSRIVALPFAIAAIVFVYFAFLNPKAMFLVWIIVPVIGMVLTYLFEPQIDFWWLERNPVDLDEKVVKLLHSLNPEYGKLSDHIRERYDNRLMLYVNAIDISSKGMERDFKVPEDIKYLIAQVPVMMTMNKSKFLLQPFERIILYKHAFGSPRFKFLHTAETFLEDGVIILSLQHAEAAFFNRSDFYNNVYHAFAEAYIKAYPKVDYPEFNEGDWQHFESVSGFSKDIIHKTIGFETLDALTVGLALYFSHNEPFKTYLPHQSKVFDKHFKM